MIRGMVFFSENEALQLKEKNKQMMEKDGYSEN